MDNNPKETAKKLREAGYSLDEICKEIKAPRSTIYYWISKTPLTVEQKVDLEMRMIEARKLGGMARHNQRLASIITHNKNALDDIKRITDRELFLLGIALYWAEGAKQKNNNKSCGADFCNQDPEMILLFCKWLDIVGISREMRRYTLYLHKQHESLEARIKSIWKEKLGQYIQGWQNTVFKKHPSNREATSDYIGLMRVKVIKSTDLNRKISGWINAINSLT